jgi:hypothetical protein
MESRCKPVQYTRCEHDARMQRERERERERDGILPCLFHLLQADHIANECSPRALTREDPKQGAARTSALPGCSSHSGPPCNFRAHGQRMLLTQFSNENKNTRLVIHAEDNHRFKHGLRASTTEFLMQSQESIMFCKFGRIDSPST